MGDFCWIGEGVWIDNIAEVIMGKHVCVSQGAYVCTGSHDWSSISFDLVAKPIMVGSHVWVGARAILAPGSRIGVGCVVTLGSVASGNLDPWTIYSGVPATPIKLRTLYSSADKQDALLGYS